MAIFTGIATALFAGTFLAGTIAVSLTAGALALATSIGINYAIASLTRKNTQQSATAESHFAVQGKLVAGGDVPRAVPLGRFATAGQLVYVNTWGNSGDTPNAYFTKVIALADLPVQSLDEVWINGVKCTLGNTPHSDFGYPVTQYTKDGVNYAWVKFHDGTQTTADSFLVSRVSSSARPYQSTRVGRGVAYVVATFLVNDTLYSGFPELKFACTGAKLYDPSKDSTNGGSGSQRWSDPNTWGGDGDHLPAVQLYNLLRGVSYNGAWVYGLQAMTSARLPATNWVAAINKCRATIQGESGLEPIYRSGGLFNVDVRISDAVSALLTAANGRLAEVGGFYKLYVGEPDTVAAVPLSDDDILSTEGQNFTPFFGLDSTINGITGSYPEPAEGWSSKVAPPLYSPSHEIEDGNRRLLSNVEYSLVPYRAQVQRCMKAALAEARRERRHTFVLPPKFQHIEPGDILSWDSVRNGYSSKYFRVDGATDKANLDVILNVTEIDPSDYDWSHSIDFQPVTIGPAVSERPAAQAIVDWYVEPYIMRDASGLERRPAIRLSWDGSLPGVSGVAFAVRLASDQSVVYRNRTDFVTAGSVIISQGLLPGTNYEVQGQYIPSAPRDVIPSDWTAVTTPDVRLSSKDLALGIQYNISDLQRQMQEEIRALDQRVSNLVASVSARGVIDKQVLHQETADGYARVQQVSTALSTLDQSFASYQTTVTASLGTLTASVTENSEAITTLEGFVGARWSVTVNANNAVSGISLISGASGVSAFIVQADKFQVQLPSHAGGASQAVFTLGTVNGSAAIGFSGNMYLDGTIYARHLNVSTLSAISANCGSLTAGTLTATNGKMLIDLNNSRELFSD